MHKNTEWGKSLDENPGVNRDRRVDMYLCEDIFNQLMPIK